MTAKEKILERVRKLLALATSNNVNEAAAAAAAAQRLIAEHQLDEAEIAAREGAPEPPVGMEALGEQWQNVPTWQGAIVDAIATSTGAKLIEVTSIRRGKRHKELRIAGTGEALALVRYLGAHVVGEIKRLHHELRPARAPRTWSTSFATGAAVAVVRRIREEMHRTRQAAEEAGRAEALAVIDAHAARLAEVLPPDLRQSRRTMRPSDLAGFEAGVRAGKGIALSGHGQMTAGHRALTGGRP